MNPRVVAWARAHNIDPAKLVRESLDDDLFRVGGQLWTVLFMEWIQAKWREWRKLCTYVPDAKHPLCDHCHNHEAFDAWLQGETHEHED